MTKSLLIIVLTLCLTTANGQQTQTTSKQTKTKKMGNIETVKRMYELFATKDNSAIRQIFDENIKWNQMKGFPGGGQLVQLSDVFIGLMGKLAGYLNTNIKDKIDTDFSSLTKIQERNIDLLIDLIDKSSYKNIGFLHFIDSYEELSKMEIIKERRNKL